MPAVKITITDTTTLRYKPVKGYTAEKVAELLRKEKLVLEGVTLVLPFDPPAEGMTVVAEVTSIQTHGMKRTVNLV